MRFLRRLERPSSTDEGKLGRRAPVELKATPERHMVNGMIKSLGGRSSWAVFTALFLSTLAASLATASVAPKKVFYLQVKVGQCTLRPHSKLLLVVPCSNPNHSLETYAVAHGGWGTTPPSHSAIVATANSQCRSWFQRRFGHPIPTGYGFEYFFPDPGAETTKYGDRVICALRLWPAYGPMGAGFHHG